MQNMTLVEKLLQVYEENYYMLRVRARSLTDSAEDAEDVMQDVLLHILEMPERIKNDSNLLGFLQIMIRNRSHDLSLKNKRSVPAEEHVISILAPSVDSLDLQDAECIEAINSILEDQPKEIIDAFIKHVIYGYRIKELAKELGMSPNSLTKRFTRMEAKLARNIDLILLPLIYISVCHMAHFHDLLRY